MPLFFIYFSLYSRYIHTSFIHKHSLRPISISHFGTWSKSVKNQIVSIKWILLRIRYVFHEEEKGGLGGPSTHTCELGSPQKKCSQPLDVKLFKGSS